MMKVKRFEFNIFGECTYVAYDEQTKMAAIIDPGMINEEECAQLDSYIEKQGLTVDRLLATHIHVDHVVGVWHVEKKYGVTLSASADDLFLAERIVEQVQQFHLPIEITEPLTVSNILTDGDIIPLGKDAFEVIAVPGHSPGSLAFYSKKSGIVFTGDALFQNSIGRADLPGGNLSDLIYAIKERLLTLPDPTIVYPGHGAASTIGKEKRFNPFL